MAIVQFKAHSYRCAVTDANGQTVTSDATALYLEIVPKTGDASDIALYTALAVLSVCALSILVRRARKHRRD